VSDEASNAAMRKKQQPVSHNIRQYQNQRALQIIVTDVDDEDCEFHIASNDGA